MNLELALCLLVALARCLDLPPQVLAEMFNDKDGNQGYYDQLVALARKQEPIKETA